MYTTRFCPFCIIAKKIFSDLSVSYSEIRIDEKSEKRREMMELTGRNTVPQIFIGDRHIGGCDDLQHALCSGQLIQWLKEVGTNV